MPVDIVIVGAGPTGLMLACELALAGVRPFVLDRLPEPSGLPKANGLVGQIVRHLDQRGLLDTFGADAPIAGPAPFYQFAGLPLDLRETAPSPLHLLVLPQERLERLLGARAAELGVHIRRGHELIHVAHDERAVTAQVHGPDGPYRLSARYLVGCDGTHSRVREQAGIGFPTLTGDQLTRQGEVTLPASMHVADTGELDVPGLGRLPAGFTRTPTGTFGYGSFRPGSCRIAVTESTPPPAATEQPLTLDELRAAVRRVLGTDLPMSDARWLSRIPATSGLADRYRAGRILLAGDAAHDFATGGSALNTGLGDALGLGWKLATRIHGRAPDTLLDTHHTERHTAGAHMLALSRAEAALQAPGVQIDALRDLFGDLLDHHPVRRHIAQLLNDAAVTYDMPGAPPHPLLGRPVPDLTLHTDREPTRLAVLLRHARPVLLDLTADPRLREAAGPWLDRIDLVTGRPTDPPVPAHILLIRPDGYVAWAADRFTPADTDPLHTALTTWFGAPHRTRRTGAGPRITPG